MPVGTSQHESQGRAPARLGQKVALLCEHGPTLLVGLATLWMLLAASWQLAAPYGAGHAAVVPARGIIAENMWTWATWEPVRTYTLTPPRPDQVYANHPYGTFWAQALAFGVFGRHTWTFRLLPILLSTAMPPLLYAFGRRLYRPWPAALAAVAYATLPSSLAFAQFPGFELAVMVASLGTALCAAEHWHTGRRRWLVASAVFLLWGCHSDWVFYVFLATGGAGVGLSYGLFTRASERAWRRGRMLPWWGLASFVAGASLLFYLAELRSLGQLAHVLGQAEHRSAGSQLPLWDVLGSRAYWIEAMFPPPAILIGLLALPLIVWRWWRRGAPLEGFTLGLLGAATLHYLLFKNGADVHIYWPLPFAAYAALAVGQLADALADPRLGSRLLGSAAVRGYRVAAAGLLPLLWLPDGVATLAYARATGLRLNDDGHLNLQDADKAAAIASLRRRFEGEAVIGLHTSLKPDWAQEWNVGRAVRVVAGPPRSVAAELRYILCDARFMTSLQQRQAAEFGLEAIGPFWLVDLAQPAGEARAFALRRREPTLLEWVASHGSDPVYSVAPDPWLTWALADHFGPQAPPPRVTPRGEPAQLVAHNWAVRSGQRARAAGLRRALLQGADQSVATRFADGSELLAMRVQSGVAPRLLLYFMAAGPIAGEPAFEVSSFVEASPWWSWVRADDKEKLLGGRFTLRPGTWKEGYLYRWEGELRPRPGREQLVGRWVGRSQAGRPLQRPSTLPLGSPSLP